MNFFTKWFKKKSVVQVLDIVDTLVEILDKLQTTETKTNEKEHDQLFSLINQKHNLDNSYVDFISLINQINIQSGGIPFEFDKENISDSYYAFICTEVLLRINQVEDLYCFVFWTRTDLISFTRSDFPFLIDKGIENIDLSRYFYGSKEIKNDLVSFFSWQLDRCVVRNLIVFKNVDKDKIRTMKHTLYSF